MLQRLLRAGPPVHAGCHCHVTLPVTDHGTVRVCPPYCGGACKQLMYLLTLREFVMQVLRKLSHRQASTSAPEAVSSASCSWGRSSVSCGATRGLATVGSVAPSAPAKSKGRYAELAKRLRESCKPRVSNKTCGCCVPLYARVKMLSQDAPTLGLYTLYTSGAKQGTKGHSALSKHVHIVALVQLYKGNFGTNQAVV